MAPLVVTFVIGRWVGAVGGRGDACFEIEAFQQPSEPIAVVGLVSQDGASGLAGHQIRGRQDVIALPGAEDQAQRSPPRINEGMDFGVCSAPTATNSLVFGGSAAAHGVFVNLGAG